MRARASVRGDGSREEERTVAASLARRESFPWPSAKEERRGQAGDTSPSAGRWGVYGNFFFGETVMHVSPISVTKRLLAAFCPRDNSPPFFMAAPILGWRIIAGKSVHFGAWGNMCDGYSSLSKTQMRGITKNLWLTIFSFYNRKIFCNMHTSINFCNVMMKATN